tara:strand:+ start:443 stop:2851 length:2409 start_codon:yes stop_codon:yes gene_type:complete
MCSAIELEGEMIEDKEKWLCITCHDSTRSNNNNKKKKKKRTTKKRKHKAGETSQQHDEDFAAAFGDVRTGNGTNSDAGTIGTTATTTGANAITDSSSTLPPVESSISKKQKIKKPKTRDRHQSNLRRFMDHTHGRTEAAKNLFEKEHVWTNDEMFAITPDQVVRHLKVRAYNNPDADIETARPTFCRLETLQSIKKGISFFHPEKDTDWNVRNKTGNPTRSVVVRNLMKKVATQELAGNGADSKERGPFVEEEFEQTIRMLEGNDNVEERLFSSSIFRTQYNLGGRVDDVSKQKCANIIPNKDVLHSNISLITRLPWSKNVKTKKQAPWQILIGAAHPCYCVLIGLAVWLEYMIIYGRDAESEFVFAFRGSNDEDAIKRKASDIMGRVLKDPAFITVLNELKGTHSMRKFATDMAKKKGIVKDWIDHRFRWLSKRMQDNYASTTIASIDGLVAAALCKDGPIHYHLKEYSGINDEWVCDTVCPNITQKYGKQVGKVLGRALLWAVFDTEQTNVVPNFMVNRIKEEYNKVITEEKQIADGENPIAKVPLYVSGDTNGNLILEPMIEGVNEEEDIENETDNERMERLRNRYDEKNLKERAVVQRSNGEQMDRISSNQAALDRRINSIEGNNERRHEVILNRFDRQDNLLRQVLKQPYRVLEKGGRRNNRLPDHDGRISRLAAANSSAEAASEALRLRPKLIDNPRCLHTLWMEYEFGLGGKKAAKLFTDKERGADRSRYSKRLIFWSKISEMIRSGWTSTAAINAVTEHYGTDLSVSKIILKMQKDRGGKSRKSTYPAILNLPS